MARRSAVPLLPQTYQQQQATATVGGCALPGWREQQARKGDSHLHMARPIQQSAVLIDSTIVPTNEQLQRRSCNAGAARRATTQPPLSTHLPAATELAAQLCVLLLTEAQTRQHVRDPLVCCGATCGLVSVICLCQQLTGVRVTCRAIVGKSGSCRGPRRSQACIVCEQLHIVLTATHVMQPSRPSSTHTACKSCPLPPGTCG